MTAALAMTGGILLGAAVSGYLLRVMWPVPGLTFVKAAALCGTGLPPQTKKLDVRDASYYEECHLDGTVNISLGRLPFVWNKELSPEDPVLILADRRLAVMKAARILRRRGFKQLYALRGEVCQVRATLKPCFEKKPAC
ncbi:rhodanese-like domain-containing protein [Paenibacillus phocaensis]|uniref:rhodanese-like domain-containing protein n=1 Tax=Paenibacillus phocaensis TaxID=1776378 RepID=UPI0003AA0BFE|nr:rhodanese-like domain-containing protein [Paenibacillus phocaensis]